MVAELTVQELVVLLNSLIRREDALLHIHTFLSDDLM